VCLIRQSVLASYSGALNIRFSYARALDQGDGLNFPMNMGANAKHNMFAWQVIQQARKLTEVF
jgi:hypothetical protein